MPGKSKNIKILFWLILISTLVRGIIAAFIELGNDEVYYVNFALYLDWSHFDHPPMVGYIIQLFSLNLLFENEIFIRLGSIILGSINTYIIFLIGKKIKNETTGLYAAFLFTASIYCFVIVGIFILPDTPQVFFWLLSLYLLLSSLPSKQYIKAEKRNLILAGITIGFAMLSKYTSVFLWAGAGVYILLYNFNWLKKKEVYISVILSFLIFLPVLIWNYNNDFISFTFHGERVIASESIIRLDYFFAELGGQIFYNNPVNFIVILITLFSIGFGKKFLSRDYKRLLLSTSLPLIILFLVFSLFRRTLPHWTAPAYLSLILLAAAYLENKCSLKKRLIPNFIKTSIGFLILLILLGFLQINYGLLFQSHQKNLKKIGKNDVTLDMYGWSQLGEKFKILYQNDLNKNNIKNDAIIVSHRWFPAANLDYYVARPLDIKLLAIGKLERIHRYAWINNYRGGFKKGMDAYFLTSSRDYQDPNFLYKNYFQEIEKPDTIQILRNGKTVKNVFVFRMKNLKKLPEVLIQE